MKCEISFIRKNASLFNGKHNTHKLIESNKLIDWWIDNG